MKRFLIIIPIGILAFSLSYLPRISFSSDETDVKVHTYQPDGKKCSFCHKDIIKHDVLHAPVADECETCHQSTGNKHPRAGLKGFTLTEKTPELCYICHEQKSEKIHLHAPVESGECSSCHASHGSNYKNLLTKESSLLICNECHNIDISESVNVHAAIELDGCQSCHLSHQSDYDFLLVEEKSNICFICHDAERVFSEQMYQHAPFSDDCSNCHNPHSSKNKYLLTASSGKLCFTCHDDIGQKLKDSKFVHKVAEDEKGCSNCHSPHASSFPKILTQKRETLCFKCHNEEIKTDNKTVENIDKKIKVSKYKHSALEPGGCNLCHDPHASDNVSLLIGSFPKSEYAPASSTSFELCFTCHDSEMIEKEFTETTTDFRNGKQNLHYIHINRDKGRNCNICHDMHASDNKYLIKNRTQFGTWDMPMNFKVTQNGATCRTGCHTEKKYDRVNVLKNDNINIDNDYIVTEHNIVKEDSLVSDSVIFQEDTLITEVDMHENSNDTEHDTLVVEKDDSEKEKVYNQDTIHIDEKDKEIMEKVDKDSVLITNIEPGIQKDTTIFKPDSISTKKNTIQEKPTAEEAFEKIKSITIEFKYAKAEINKNVDNEITIVIEFLKEYSNVVIEICGHTDSKGSFEYNIDLSRKRAQAVKDMLSSEGLNPERVNIKAYGESKPIKSNTTEEGRTKNRRVEFKIQKN